MLEGAVECLRSTLACLIEDGDRPGIVAFMNEHGMQGPFYYRHRQSRLQRSKQNLPEDQVFVGRGFAKAFPDIAIETA